MSAEGTTTLVLGPAQLDRPRGLIEERVDMAYDSCAEAEDLRLLVELADIAGATVGPTVRAAAARRH